MNRHPIHQRFPSPRGPIVSDLDCILWDFVLFSGQRYDKIILLEADMLFRCPIREFFEASLHLPLSGSTVRIGVRANQDWCWYQRASSLARERFGDLVASVSPVAGIQMDWELAERMAKLVMRSNGLFDDMHVELAIGTLARMLGVDAQPTVVPPGTVPEDFIDWNPQRIKPGPWGVFHPVKKPPPTMKLGLDTAPPLTVLTLWRSPIHATQDDTLEYLAAEDFPKGTQFLWMVAPGTDTEAGLQRALQEDERWADRRVQLLPAPESGTGDRGEYVAQLMNAALLEVEAAELLLVEDDMVPQPGDWAALRETWQALPPHAAACMAGYPSRQRPTCFCAGDIFAGYVPLEEAPEKSPQSVNWVGGGYTLYRSADVEACLPLKTENRRGYPLGWDVILSERLRTSQRKVYLAHHLEVEHRWQS